MARKATPQKPVQPDLVEKILASVLPSQRLSPENFTRLCAAYPAREAAAVYVYRGDPKIDRRKAGHKYNYIDKLALDDSPIDADRLLPAHGSGRYMLQLNDENRPKRLRELAMTILTIHDPEHPPVVPLEELVWEAPENRSYIQGLRARGICPPTFDDQPQPGAQSGGSAVTLALLNEVVRGRQQKPPDVLGEAAKAATAFREMAEAVRPAESDSVSKALLAHCFSLEKMVLEGRPQAAPSGDLDALDRVLSIMDRLEKRMPRGNPEVAPASSPEGIMESAASLVQAISPLVLALMGRRTVETTGREVEEEELPAALPAGAQTDKAGAAKVEIDFEKMFGLVPQAFRAFNSGVSGRQFAESLKIVAPELLAKLCTLEEPEIIGPLEASPLWAQLAPRENEIRVWVRDFLSAGAGQAGPPGKEASVQ
jgi:hypothetical protein